MKFHAKVFSKRLRPLYLLIAIVVLCSHDLYVKMETYFLEPNKVAVLSLYNGTFEKSENIITRDRIIDASFVNQGKRVSIDPDQWVDKDSTVTQLAFHTGEAGTYVVGVSTKARNIELTSDKFNKYLKHDGVLDMLERRTTNNLLDQDAVESYQKHVKAIYQVGESKTNNWNTILGYPIEFVPKDNPYEKYSGESLEVQLLLDGKPLANQLVYADYIEVSHHHHHGHSHDDHKHDHSHKKHSHDASDSKNDHHKHEHEHKHKHKKDKRKHDHDGKEHSHKHEHGKGKHHEHDDTSESEEEHTHTNGQQLRTNDQGVVTVELPEDGIYYLRTIYMTEVTDSDELTHESKWATLTFEVTHQHHDHGEGIPTWVFVLGSLILIGILFLVFRKKNG